MNRSTTRPFRDKKLRDLLTEAQERANDKAQTDYIESLSTLDDWHTRAHAKMRYLPKAQRAEEIAQLDGYERAVVASRRRAASRPVPLALAMSEAAANRATTVYQGHGEWRGSAWRVLEFFTAYCGRELGGLEMFCAIRTYNARRQQVSVAIYPAGQSDIIEDAWRARVAKEVR